MFSLMSQCRFGEIHDLLWAGTTATFYPPLNQIHLVLVVTIRRLHQPQVCKQFVNASSRKSQDVGEERFCY
jgi:hypothetical protein